MATKNDKRRAREIIEGLEYRAHRGPPIREAEIQSARDLLHQRGFSPASDYFGRLSQLADRLQGRGGGSPQPPAKRNYGGQAAGRKMQMQSVFDHVIVSTCYEGAFNGKRGRVKISHRFNQEGRIDFVELKFLRSLHRPLDGELRKLLLITGYQSIRKDWREAQAAVLRILPRELLFLYERVFESEREQILAWLVNIGHGIVDDLLKDLRSQRVIGAVPALDEGWVNWADLNWTDATETGVQGQLQWLLTPRNGEAVNGGSGNGHHEADSSPGGRAGVATINGEEEDTDRRSFHGIRNPDQLSLEALVDDEVALPILEKAAGLESVVEVVGPTEVVVRYLGRASP